MHEFEVFVIFASDYLIISHILQFFLQQLSYFRNCRQKLSKLRIYAHNRNLFLLKSFGYVRDKKKRIHFAVGYISEKNVQGLENVLEKNVGIPVRTKFSF